MAYDSGSLGLRCVRARGAVSEGVLVRRRGGRGVDGLK